MTELIKTFKIKNKFGIHARAAAKIVQLANQYDCELYLKKNDQEVDGTSILSILTLAGTKGTEIQARIVGNNCQDCMEKLHKLIEDRFGETQ
jgi:phosphocarrier protein